LGYGSALLFALGLSISGGKPASLITQALSLFCCRFTGDIILRSYWLRRNIIAFNRVERIAEHILTVSLWGFVLAYGAHLMPSPRDFGSNHALKLLFAHIAKHPVEAFAAIWGDLLGSGREVGSVIPNLNAIMGA
jgi:hypothetical protein